MANGVPPEGLPWSLWELLEHVRLAQRDILAFCTEEGYEEGDWPDDYWPKGPAPETEVAWDASIAGVLADRAALQSWAMNAEVELFAKAREGSERTRFSALVLIADHTAYHLGQMIAVRRVLGNWRA